MTRRGWRRGIGLPVALALAGLGAAPAHAASQGPVPVVVVDGRGFGHGVGMAQEGAHAMGVAGSTTAQILGRFYPGTTPGQAAGQVRVPVLTASGGSASLSFPSGGEIRSAVAGAQASGFPLAVGPGQVVTVRHDGSYHASVAPAAAMAAQQAAEATIVEPPGPAEGPAPPEGPPPVAATPAAPPSTLPPLTPVPAFDPPAPPPAGPPGTAAPETAAPGPSPAVSEEPAPSAPGPEITSALAPPGLSAGVSDRVEVSSPSPLLAVPAPGSTVALGARSARYRGVIEATAAGGSLRLVNRVDVEDYLRGMGEVRDPRWPAAALGAQAVAARTYALRAMAKGGEICPTQRCQVYLGQQAEYAAMDTAVRATRGQVLRYGSELAVTVYSANGGGVTATPKEGFGPGATDLAYLRSVPYPTRDTDEWQTRIGLADVAARLGYPSTLRSVRVSATGPSGRATSVELNGDAGARTVSARSFGKALGLRSTLWSLSTGSADAAPLAPAAADDMQMSPEAFLATLAPLEVPAVFQDRMLDAPAPIATAVAGPPAVGSGDAGQPLWVLYAAVFLVTASRRRLRGLWARSG